MGQHAGIVQIQLHVSGWVNITGMVGQHETEWWVSMVRNLHKTIRLMVSLLIHKHVRNLSDENLVEHWSENLYYQYFSGEQFFQPNIPCVPTDLVAFRQRIGEESVELILKKNIRLNEPGDDVGNDIVVSVDTTVQEKNITYPTDDKLYKK